MKTEITGLSSDGRGICRIDNKVCFVAGTVPGDKIEPIDIISKKNYSFTDKFKLIEASPHRVKAPCPYFGQCGGCSWQHIEYSQQLLAKRDNVVMALRKIAKIENSDALTSDCIPSDLQTGYRNRTVVHSYNTICGYYMRKSSRVIEIDKCLLLEKPLEDAPLQVKKMVDEKSIRGKKDWAVSLTEKNEVRISKYSGDTDYDFSQVNSNVNDKLKKAIAKLTEEIFSQTGKLKILDLYCGDGNLSLQLAQYSSELLGYDLSGNAIGRAKKKVQAANLLNVKFLKGNVAEIVNHKKRYGSFDLLITDPPRDGMKSCREKTAELGVKHVLYVSCDPASAARDMKEFFDAGYVLKSAQPFDMFPQTPHVETLFYLTKD